MAGIITASTCETATNFLLDSGAVFKNFDVMTDTFESARIAGKLLGATRGGSTFTATPTTRNREVDGLRGVPTGGIAIDDWTVTLVSNFIEVTPDTLQAALGAAKITTTGVNVPEGYKLIQGKSSPEREDYIQNVTWLGTLNGSEEPVIIQIFNAMSTSGITLSLADKSEAVLAVTFAATYDLCGGTQDPNYAPFKIFYPPKREDIIGEEEEDGGNA